MLNRRQLLGTSALGFFCRCGVPLLSQESTSKKKDYRLGKNKDLNGYFPFVVPKTKEDWTKRRQRIRQQVMVANGLWPMPEKTPLKPLIHGKIERDGYTIEKVSFASTPGHYVTGNLYRPVGKKGPFPGVLSPHGHWKDGRFYENSDAGVENELKSGAEKTREGARYPLQARCAALAQLGMVVFHYDMIGYADSQGIKHILRSGVPAEDGFADAEAELRLQSLMGLQTWNSIRALDFLESLGDVDPKRLACTGASGGGTQTFLLAAIDDRLAAAFPAVMVSTAMQGGCVCENCSLLRVGTGNIELAGLFAPKPMALSAANDWTKEIATKGAPELKKLYQLLGAESKFAYQAWLEHGHNYNQLAREFMYTWFHEHLLGEKKPITEPKFVPVPPKELSVYDDQHPRPKDELPAHLLRKKLTISSDTQIKSLLPKDAASLEKYHKLISAAVRAMICDELPEKLGVLVPPVEKKYDTVTMHTTVFTRTDEDVALPMSGIFTKEFKDRVVIWIHPKGKASLRDQDTIAAPALTLVKAGYAVVAPDLLGVGDLALPSGYEVSKIYAGFTYGYNRSLFAHRVHDILTAICFAQSMLGAKTIHLVGWGSFGPHAVVARAAVGKVITKMAADLNQFRFESITKTDDPMLLPGAVKYGGVPAFLAAAAPLPALVHNLKGIGSLDLPKQAYAISGSDFQRSNLPLAEGKVVEWLLQG